ncbi:MULTISPECIES: glycosyltransferase family 2 protein [Flavobacterium]|uniref:glycosyltransferase family 2 protein n=1 Tax=Flavobacterium TaxID=237 RepID=UPI001FCBC576|nr:MULTISPECIES: glycosyltransferase family 2 protein [Flavobacterium]UOK43784.1 glycosyltransferase [Flavobacterium enshiense]
MNSKLVSVIVPCYNQAQYLDECLQSVLDQTYQNWECIIVNDGSLDETKQVVKKWIKIDTRFRCINIENKGVSGARNLGVKLSKGEYIQFLDGDDILENNKLAYQVNVLNKDLAIDIVYGSSRYFFHGDKLNLYPIHYNGIIPLIEMHKNDRYQKDVLVYRNICTNCSALYRRKIFEKIYFRNLVYEDWFFHIECALNSFVFHYSGAENTKSLVRMTLNSQMNKHAVEAKSSDKFEVELKSILDAKKFSSRLIEERENNICVTFHYERRYFFKLVNNVMPPILMKLFKRYFS